MKAARKKTRKFLFQKLYASLYTKVDESKFHDSFFDGVLDFSLDKVYIDEMFELIQKHQKYFLSIIKIYAPKFDLEKMNKTNILAICIGICEMKFLTEEIPAKVSMNEAVEIAKVYGDDSSWKIVNAIINNYYNDFEKYSDIEKISQFDGTIF